MTKLKEFRETVPSWMKLSFLDALQLVDTSKTNKFLPMLTKMVDASFKGRVNNINHTKELIYELENKLPHLKGSFNNLDVSTLLSLHAQFNQISFHELETMSEFIRMYENHQISNVDINKLTTFNELESIINIVGIKNLGKEYAKQIHVDLDNDKWLVIRPLTHESSLKYGANTKWCTASKNNPYQFFRYTEEGCLIYCINKETGYKLAFHMFKEGDKFYDVSFWNSIDDRIDSLSAEIDFDVYTLIKEIYSDTNTKTNKELGGEYWLKSYENYRENQEVETEAPTLRTNRTLRILENGNFVGEYEDYNQQLDPETELETEVTVQTEYALVNY